MDAVRLHPSSGLDALITALTDAGYRVVGPTVRDGVVVYDDLDTADDLPDGCRVEQSPGHWRLRQTDLPGRFSWTPGADSWKRFVFPSHSEVLRVRRSDGSFVVTHPEPPDRPLAVIGARDCELRALEILDRVFLDADHPDPRYAARRDGMFVVAVTCGEPGGTCWCTSTGGGPRPRQRYDLLLTEVIDGGHRFVVEVGTERGRQLLVRLPAGTCRESGEADTAAVDDVVAAALDRLPQRVDTGTLPEQLAGTDRDPYWDVVAARCLSCGNCTSVCPTCFCSTFGDRTDLLSDEVVREQTWVSCFQLDHSHLGGRPVRATTAARYRQWLTHKLGTWPEQFGTNGCVGCGRCSTWCPAGIDLPAEAAQLTGAST